MIGNMCGLVTCLKIFLFISKVQFRPTLLLFEKIKKKNFEIIDLTNN